MFMCLYVCDLFGVYVVVFFFFKQKTAYEMRISDWSSDVCSSDLPATGMSGASMPLTRPPTMSTLMEGGRPYSRPAERGAPISFPPRRVERQIGRASCRERVCQYV